MFNNHEWCWQGDSSVLAYEVAEEEPYFHSLATYSGDGLHQALSFLPKSHVDVKKVEFAKAWKLMAHTVEPVSFTVPRIKVSLPGN